MSSSAAEQVKERLNIVEVISQYVKLTKSGKNYKGLSPFKKEKTPSFYVSPDKGMYYDFSTNRGGDVFTFVQEMEGVDFMGALTMLAERAGVTITRESKGARDARERLYACIEDACRFFETKLTEEPTALAYLRERGLEESTARLFRLGFAPESWDALRTHLVQLGYSERECVEAGLIKQREGGGRGTGTYDRFRSRIMFPLRDTAGRVVAFSGRIFGEAAKDKENAKYINSPEGPLFDKSRILYGYDKAKAVIRKHDFAILVEGQMDLVMSHQAGYGNTVAVSGTALTDAHLELIGRLSKKLVLALDTDSAGIASTLRAGSMALARGMDVKVARIPSGKDPADAIRESVEAWKAAVREAEHIVTFFLRAAAREERDERARALRVRDQVLPLVAHMQSPMDQAHFVREVALSLELPPEAVAQEVRTLGRGSSVRTTSIQAAPHERAASPAEKPSRRIELERVLAGAIFWQADTPEPMLTEDSLRERTHALGLELGGIIAKHSTDRERLSFEAECVLGESTDVAAMFDTLMVELARLRLEEERASLSQEIRRLERAGDREAVAALLADFTHLARKLEQLG